MSVSSGGAQLATGQANVRQLGTSIFTTYLFSFEATAALLMIAVIGAVVLARRENAQVATEGDVE
jgi:NADH-quinone oxidoreductase subunit J